MVKRIFVLIVFLFLINISIIFSKNILILNSYHRYLSWTDNICNTIVSKFPKYTFFVEYMDTKRFKRDIMFKIFLYYLKNKYKSTKIDLIVVTDNNAFDFIIKYHKELFPKIPVVFCGVNNFRESMLKGDEYVTGVVENVYLKDTVDLILKLHPKIKNIYAIMGATFTSQIYYKNFLSLKKQYEKRVNINIINGKFYTKKEFSEKLKSINNGVIFLTNLFQLKDGTIFSIKSCFDFINKYCNLPIYTCWNVMFNFKNVVGGKITSSYKQGEYASKFIYQILEIGVPVYVLPVLTKSPAEYMFNFKYLKKFNIPIENLPENSKIIGAPSKEKIIISQQQQYIKALSIFSTLLIFLIFLLILAFIKNKKTENRLNEVLEEYMTIVNSSADMVCVKDGKGRWIITNDANLKLFSLENIDYKGKTDRELAEYSHFFKEAFLKCEKSDEIAWNKKEIIRVEEKIPQPNGKTRIFDIIKIPVFSKNGERKRLIVIGRDITEIKEMHEQMIHFQKMDLLGNLAAGIAHDFNNILASLSMNAELIALSSQDKKVKKYVNNIIKSIDNAKNLINRIKITARKEERILSINNIIEIVNHSLEILKPSLPSNISIKKLYNENEPIFIKCDFHEISQVLMNIILNSIDAIKMAKREVGTIIIDLLKKEKYLTIKISDNGIGIDDTIKEKIFEPFFSTKDKTEIRGTGLGLAICKKIVTDHNGKIYVKSQKGVGSDFYIELPIINSEKKLNNMRTDDEKSNSILKKIKNKTILLIEDEEDIIKVEKELLENLGFNVLCARNGKQGIEIFLKNMNKIDIIFLDWKMPVMDGEATVKEIRKIDKNIPIFLVTGAIDEKILKMKNTNAITNIISKPFKVKNIIKKLNCVFEIFMLYV